MGGGDVTRLLAEWRQGRRDAFDRLVPLIYDQLRRLAAGYLGHERTDHTLQPTALVNEAYMRLVGGSPPELQNRLHFFAIAARVMRQILVEHARAHQAAKRGSGIGKVPLDEAVALWDPRSEVLLDLEAALERLSAIDARKAQVVELHYFGGLSCEEIAQALEVSAPTVGRDLAFAKSWLHREMTNQ